MGMEHCFFSQSFLLLCITCLKLLWFTLFPVSWLSVDPSTHSAGMRFSNQVEENELGSLLKWATAADSFRINECWLFVVVTRLQFQTGLYVALHGPKLVVLPILSGVLSGVRPSLEISECLLVNLQPYFVLEITFPRSGCDL